jgi:hypothetical protein
MPKVDIQLRVEPAVTHGAEKTGADPTDRYGKKGKFAREAVSDARN